jgi:mRNA-degrading endonuclease RelE of RelBE toxin-antitoxin system
VLESICAAYRVGSYRILAKIDDDVVTVFVIDIDRSKTPPLPGSE